MNRTVSGAIIDLFKGGWKPEAERSTLEQIKKNSWFNETNYWAPF